ncbi:hypothetical protein N7G274_006601 [Stereocaulon virgatum]|uniref:S-adenosyl-L-methionine-dependent methyltransferase n=1 Tax=Stereocaulon virgatum TaxID=373712 RepID=A0ABR4A8D3_9LECA
MQPLSRNPHPRPHQIMTTSTTTDLTVANRTFFNDYAAEYDTKPWQKQITLQITNYIQQNLDFISIPKHSDPTTLLDYACGTGTISRALGPSVTSIQALDLSSKMVERFNELAVSSEIPSVRKARAIEGNLLTDDELPVELNGPEFHDFDVAAIGAGLHHFDDPAKAIGRLAERLRVGGVLLLVDFVDEGEHGRLPTGAEHTVRKHGFSEKEMKEMMEGHGLAGFGWKEMPERLELKLREDESVSRKGFLARAEKV